MKLRNKIFAMLIGLFAIPLQNKAQQVINSAGGDRQLGTSGIYISDNVGEPFTQTFGAAANFMITQGYLQPYIEAPATFSSSAIINHLVCKDKNEDAFIDLQINTSVSSYTTVYYWSPSIYCPNNNCSKIDSLSPGNYSVSAIVYYKNRLGALKQDTIKKTFAIFNSDVICQVKIYSGVTPNNDGVNETWQIDDIDKYPNNEVTIYNRWGYEVYKTKSYNNKINSWPPKDELNNLPSSTYFYIIELGDGSKPIKGWVELIKD